MATEAEIKEFSQYGYIPTQWVTILFIVLFSISTAIHLGQSLYWRRWFLLPTAVLAGLGEILGWSGRYWSTRTFLASGDTPYLIQISTTIIAPTFFVAANFIIFGQLIRYLGPQYCRLTPRSYSIVFCTVDFSALVVQAVGGGIASSADTVSGSNMGADIMLAGIVIQLVSIVVYSFLAIELLLRRARDQPIRSFPVAGSISREIDNRVKLMLYGLAISTLFLFIRAIYRTAELADGWHGHIIETEVYFNVLDGGMVTVAFYTLNIFHPGHLLQHVWNGNGCNLDAESAIALGSRGTLVGNSGEEGKI